MTTPKGLDDNSVVTGLELRLDTAIQGLQTAMPAGVTTIPIAGANLTIPDTIKLAQTRVLPWKSKRGANETLHQLRLDYPRDYQAALEFLADLKAGLVPILGRTSASLTSFGFKPQKKRKEPSLAKKVISHAKGLNTRAARHTVGSKQKAEIHGAEPSSVVVTPDGAVKPVAPAAPQAPPPGTGPP